MWSLFSETQIKVSRQSLEGEEAFKQVGPLSMREEFVVASRFKNHLLSKSYD